MKQKFKPETWVGVFLIIGIFLILGTLIIFGDFKDTKDQYYEINVIFKDASGLIKDSQIRLGGVPVGKVAKAPELIESGDKVLLVAEIQNDVHIQHGSLFRIDMQNILGDKFIDIVPPNPPTNRYIAPNETILGEQESDFSKIKQNAILASEELLTLLKKIESNSGNIDTALQNISEAAKGLAETTRIVNSKLLTDKNINTVSQTLTDINEIGKQIPGLIAESKTTLSNANAAITETRLVLQHANSKLKQLDPSISEIPGTLTALKKASVNISDITADAKKNQGTLGLLLYDKQFRIDLQTFISNLRQHGILRYRQSGKESAPTDPRSTPSGSRR